MKRRALLAAVAVTAGSSVAGCLDDVPGDSETTTETPTVTDMPADDDDSESSADDDDSESSVDDDDSESSVDDDDSESSVDDDDSEPPALVEQTFDVRSVNCGTQGGDVSTKTEDGVVTVEGLIDGRDGCWTAELVEAVYDPDTDLLSVEVESLRDDDAGDACVTCIVEIEYVATFTFEGGEPGSVRVDQRGAFSSSSSGSASASDGA